MNKKQIQEMFEDAAVEYPHKTALSEQGQTMTYEKLDECSDKIADDLKKQLSDSDGIVGVCLDASIGYIVAILGVLKAGFCFMPLSTRFSDDYLASILDKSRPGCIMTDTVGMEKIERVLSENTVAIGRAIGQNTKLYLHSPINEIKNFFVYKLMPEDETTKSACPDPDSCYIVTTSGSTGNPKMILGSHKGLCHFIDWEISELKLDHNLRGSFLAPVTFDVSLRDIFVPLCSGGMLCIPGEEIRIDYRKLFKWFQKNRISLTHMVPTVFRMLTAELHSSKINGTQLEHLRWILLAGEPLYGRDVNQWRAASDESNTQLVNLYGPSETTLAKMYYRIEPGFRNDDEIVPIGRPLPDTEVLILKNNKLCREGDVGEIHIKTPFASRGYLQDPEKNRLAFIKAPSEDSSENKVYRTGDYGFALPNGTIKFVGRRDGQIKLHGKKVDLGLVESHLREHGAIRNCAVAVKKDHYGYDRLVAFIVGQNNQIPDTETLKGQLRNQLPDYMVPAIFVAISELPLTHSGKINRNALPEPSSDRAVLKQKYVSPSNDIEKKLVRIWCEVLELEKVGIHDNFFDIGGSSILGMVVCTKINEVFEIDMSILKVFENPTIHAIGKYLRGKDSYCEKLTNMRARGSQRRTNFFRVQRNVNAGQ